MRRMVLFVTLCVALVLSAAHPQGQPRPTLSEDLKSALASNAPVRVIVQAEEGALTTLRFRLGRGLRRQLAGALSLDVSGSELARLAADGGLAHISKDLPVVADMAFTNQVTRADKVWAGSRSLLGLLSQPGLSGSGIGVAVIDSGIADHAALDGSRRRKGQPRLARARCLGRSVRTRHTRRGHHRRQRLRGDARDDGVCGRERAGGQPGGRARPWQQWLGLYERRHRRHRLDDRQRAPIRHPRDQSLARPSDRRTGRDRSAVPRRRARGRVRARRRRVRGQPWPDGDRHASARRHHVARQLAVCDYGRCARHERHDRSRRRSRRPIQLARSDEVRLRGQARRRRARRRHRVARKPQLLAECPVSVVARRRQRAQRLLPVDRHQHVCRCRQRRHRAAPRWITWSDTRRR